MSETTAPLLQGNVAAKQPQTKLIFEAAIGTAALSAISNTAENKNPFDIPAFLLDANGAIKGSNINLNEQTVFAYINGLKKNELKTLSTPDRVQLIRLLCEEVAVKNKNLSADGQKKLRKEHINTLLKIYENYHPDKDVVRRQEQDANFVANGVYKKIHKAPEELMAAIQQAQFKRAGVEPPAKRTDLTPLARESGGTYHAQKININNRPMINMTSGIIDISSYVLARRVYHEDIHHIQEMIVRKLLDSGTFDPPNIEQQHALMLWADSQLPGAYISIDEGDEYKKGPREAEAYRLTDRIFIPTLETITGCSKLGSIMPMTCR